MALKKIEDLSDYERGLVEGLQRSLFIHQFMKKKKENYNESFFDLITDEIIDIQKAD